jgi:hypothetical protein
MGIDDDESPRHSFSSGSCISVQNAILEVDSRQHVELQA